MCLTQENIAWKKWTIKWPTC